MNIIQNDTWYLNESNLLGELDFDSMNINECSGGKSFIHYPNIPSGYPSIAVELEDFGGFNLPKNYNSGDELTAKRYPVTYLEGLNYIVCIPLYEYYTHTGVHVTKVITTLQRNDTRLILIDHSSLVGPDAETVDKRDFCRYKYDEDSDIYYICKDEYVKLENICSFSNNKEKDKFLYSVSLGPSCNVLLDLTVDYYFYNIKLGTYKLTFNPYLLDIIKNYNTEEIIPEDNYHGSGVLYIPQFYDIEVNDLYGTIIKEENIEHTIERPLDFDKAELVSKEVMQEGKTLNTKEKMLPSNLININNSFELDNEKYLYKSDIKPLEPININYKFELKPNNCSVAVWTVKDRTLIKDDFIKSGNITIKYILLPKLLDVEEKLFYDSIYSKNGNATSSNNDLIKYKIKALSDSYTYELKFYTVELFKNFHLENNSIGNFIIKAPSCDSDTGFGYIPVNSTVASLVGKGNYKDNLTPLNPAGDDTATITLTYDSPFSANNVSDYSVIALLNTLCKIDDIYYKGYKGPDDAIYKSNINTDYNYLLLNGRSEWNLLFIEGKDYSIKHFKNTSLYHSGLIYFEFDKDVKNKEIVLDKGVYFINFNYLNGNAPAVLVKNSASDILSNINDNNVPAVPMRNSLSKILSNINNNGILNRDPNISDNKNAKSLSAIIYVPRTSSIFVSIPKDSKFSSMGLYKVNEKEGTEELNNKILLLNNRNVTIISLNILDYVYPLTVYTYLEVERECADKVYNYTNGPLHGYLILSSYYTLSDDVNAEVSGTTIQIRE